MLTVVVRRSPFTTRYDERHEVPWHGQTAAELCAAFRPDTWADDMRICVLVNSQRIDDEQQQEPLADEMEVTFGPDPQGIELLTYFLISLAVSALVGFVYARLVGGRRPNPAQERGEDKSRTYAWDQITSEYRGGFPVPFVFGEHDVGPQVIYVDVAPPPATGGADQFEVMQVILALGEGPIESIGNVTGNTAGEADYLGGFVGQALPGPTIPQNIRINGYRFDHIQPRPGLRAFMRKGYVTQRPLPPEVFSGTSSTDIVGIELRDVGQSHVHAILDAEPKVRISLVLSFPAGLFSVDANGATVQIASGAPAGLSPTGMWLRAEWRPQPATATWFSLGDIVIDPPATQAPFARSWTLDLTSPTSGSGVIGNMEVRVTRLTPAANTNGQSDRDVSLVTWRQVVYRVAQEFSYPRTALLGLQVQATEQLTYGRPNFVVRARGLLVRVWDAAINGGLPSTARYWQVPAAGDPYAGIWSYPPGRNPAWLLAEFLTHPSSLGSYVTDQDIDWPAFRDWADFCDQSVPVSGINEAAFCFDGVLDNPAKAWDTVQRICQAGRATPVMRGRQFSIKYAYFAAHGRGSNVVPQKARVALVSSTSVKDLSVTYSSRMQRPAVITAQFLDAERDYAQTTIPVDDPLGKHEDPESLNPLGYTKQSVELFGVTRKSQVVRELLFMHAANAQTSSEVSFECGPEQLPVEVGDIIGVQHDVFRPFGEQSFAARATNSGAASTSVTLNRDVVVDASTYVVLRDASDAIQEVAVTSAPGTYPTGSALTLATALSWNRGTPIAIGKQDAVVVDYEVTATTLERDLTRKIQAVRWQPTIHALTDVGSYVTPFTGNAFQSTNYDQGGDLALPVVNVRVRPSPERGTYSIGWEFQNGGATQPVRVFARPTEQQAWWSLGEYVAPPCVYTFTPGRTYEVAVASSSTLGVFQVPDVAQRITYTAEEFAPFPPANVQDAVADYAADGCSIEFAWQPLTGQNAPLVEVRKGRRLNGSELLGTTRDNKLRTTRTEYYEAGDTMTFWLRARSPSGLLSARPTRLQISAAAASQQVTLSDVDVDLSACTLSNLSIAQDLLTLRWSAQITAGYRGECITPVYSLGYDVATWLALHVGHEWSEDVLVSDVGGLRVGSGETMWRLVGGRDASTLQRGMLATERISDYVGVPIGSIPTDRTIGGYRGSAGSLTAAAVSFRYALLADVGTISSKPWLPYTGPQRIEAAAVQVRIELLRHRVDIATSFYNVNLRRMA